MGKSVERGSVMNKPLLFGITGLYVLALVWALAGW